jgi:hypothetical protein
MYLQTALNAVLPELRAEALARMTSTCTIRRKTGATTVVNNLKVPAWDDVHTDEPIRFVGGNTSRVEVAGVDYQQATSRADFRHDLDDLKDGDLVEITAGEWVGTVLRVIEATKGDQRTARRVPVAEVTRPTEWT